MARGWWWYTGGIHGKRTAAMDMAGAAAGGDVVPVVPAAAFPTSLDGRKGERAKGEGKPAQKHRKAA